MMPHTRVFIISLLTAVLLSGCTGGAMVSPGESNDPGDDMGPAQEQVRERVQARWDAIIAMDYDKVYTFATPTYRATYGLDHYRNQYAVQIIKESIELISITIPEDDPDTAFVRLNLTFVATSVPSGRYEGQALVHETWVRRDGQWWFVEPR